MYSVKPMMAASVFERAINDSLEGYEGIAVGRLFFDKDQAAELEPVEGKLYTAKSESPIFVPKRIGNGIKRIQAKLVTVLFNPVDATGILPRPKDEVDSEVHLTIASYKPFEDIKPKIFAGNLAVMGDEIGEVRRVADLGQNRMDFVRIVNRHEEAKPTATLTVGQTPSGERFGDPHFVSNPWDEIAQVAGFIALGKNELYVADLLAARRPDQI